MENKDEWGVAVVGPNCVIEPGTVVAPKAMVAAQTKPAEEAAK